MSTASVAVASDTDAAAKSSTNDSVIVPAPIGVAAPQLQTLDSQQSATENSNPTTGPIPPTADLPAHLEIPQAPAAVTAAPPPAAPASAEPSKSVVQAPPAQLLPTPAEILGLAGKDRANAEKCLANAVYFESRGEPMKGQIAVAQVVMNRVFSPYYPKDVCSVVYQNAERHLSCQFTFACDGKSKTIKDRGAWWRAQRVAKQTLDGKVWLASVAKSTHYHAYYVNPVWVSEMKKMFRFGVHTFYRPHRWGDGAEEQGWAKNPAPPLAPKATPVANQPKPQAANEQKTPATTAPVVAATPEKPKASDAKAAASNADAKAAAAKAAAKKLEEKKSDATISPIYTGGKKSDLKTAPANANAKASAKIDPKAQDKSKSAATQTKQSDSKSKSSPAGAQSKSQAAGKSTAKPAQPKQPANGHAKLGEKVTLR